MKITDDHLREQAASFCLTAVAGDTARVNNAIDVLTEYLIKVREATSSWEDDQPAPELRLAREFPAELGEGDLVQVLIEGELRVCKFERWDMDGGVAVVRLEAQRFTVGRNGLYRCP